MPVKKTEANVVEPHAASSVSATDAAEKTPLMFLNDANRKFDSWEVSVDQSHIEEYEYEYEGKPRK